MLSHCREHIHVLPYQFCELHVRHHHASLLVSFNLIHVLDPFAREIMLLSVFVHGFLCESTGVEVARIFYHSVSWLSVTSIFHLVHRDSLVGPVIAQQFQWLWPTVRTFCTIEILRHVVPHGRLDLSLDRSVLRVWLWRCGHNLTSVL